MFGRICKGGGGVDEALLDKLTRKMVPMIFGHENLLIN